MSSIVEDVQAIENYHDYLEEMKEDITSYKEELVDELVRIRDNAINN